MRIKRIFPLCLSAVTGLAVTQVQAIDPAPINLGPLDLTPTLQVSTGYDDNFRSSNDKESTWFTSIQPTFVLGAAGLKSEYELSYSFIHDYYHSFSSEKNTDHFVDFAAYFDFNSRNRLLLGADWSDTTDVTDQAEPDDKYRSRGLSALYSFGVETAPINLDFGYDYGRTRSKNDANLDKELNSQLYTSTLYYRISPRTRLLGEIRHSKQDYVSANFKDSTNRTYLAGAQWEATAFTTGSVRVGRTKKDFKDPTREDASRNMWEVGVVWEPLTYSRFNLLTRSSIEEGDDGAASIKQDLYRVGWNHQWNGFISTDANYTFTEKKYDFGRNDKNHLSSVGINYAIDRWVDLGLSYQYTDNKSTLADESYTRNMIMLTLTVGL